VPVANEDIIEVKMSPSVKARITCDTYN